MRQGYPGFGISSVEPQAEPVVATETFVETAGGAVAAGSTHAATAGARVLADGGNAVDAAIAMAAVQCVAEFPWCGVGGDLFMLVHRPDEGVAALNGAGAAPAHAVGLEGRERIPRFGPLSASVPGVPLAWELALARYGTRTLQQLLEPAVELAEEGVVVDDRLHNALVALQSELEDAPTLAEMIAGSGTEVGSRFVQKDLARSLAMLGRHGSQWFYEGEFAEKLDNQLAARGGMLRRVDLAKHQGNWTQPARIGYRGFDIYQNPPVSMGMVMLAQLQLLEQFDVSAMECGSPDLLDLMVRCKMAAFSDLVSAPPRGLTAATALALQPIPRERLTHWVHRLTTGDHGRVAHTEQPDPQRLPGGSDTTCLAVADSSGTTVTLIHSLFNQFGSRELIDGTGVVLNDRLAGLRLERDTAGAGPMFVAGARPVHTLNSYIALSGSRVAMAGASPGGRGQVQTNVQVLSNMLDHQMTPHEAVRFPRWLHGSPRRAIDDGVLHLEGETLGKAAAALRGRGYDVRVSNATDDDFFGSAVAVGTSTDGTNYAVADGRRGSTVAGSPT